MANFIPGVAPTNTRLASTATGALPGITTAPTAPAGTPLAPVTWAGNTYSANTGGAINNAPNQFTQLGGAGTNLSANSFMGTGGQMYHLDASGNPVLGYDDGAFAASHPNSPVQDLNNLGTVQQAPQAQTSGVPLSAAQQQTGEAAWNSRNPGVAYPGAQAQTSAAPVAAAMTPAAPQHAATYGGYDAAPSAPQMSFAQPQEQAQSAQSANFGNGKQGGGSGKSASNRPPTPNPYSAASLDMGQGSGGFSNGKQSGGNGKQLQSQPPATGSAYSNGMNYGGYNSYGSPQSSSNLGMVFGSGR